MHDSIANPPQLLHFHTQTTGFLHDNTQFLQIIPNSLQIPAQYPRLLVFYLISPANSRLSAVKCIKIGAG